MNYYIDTEFIEGFHKPLFGKNRHFIDLISIGIVCEDGRKYYAISKEYEYKKADDWVKKNVIVPMYTQTVEGFKRQFIHESNFHKVYGKSNAEIAREVFLFVNPHLDIEDFLVPNPTPEYMRLHNTKSEGPPGDRWVNQPAFYGYFADYDWVLFCSLYGRMLDLPSGFPMYCMDLKQTMIQHGLDSKWKKENCPEPENAHNALADAEWNKTLHEKILFG